MDSESLFIESIAPEVIVLGVGVMVAIMVIIGLLHGNSVRRKNLSQDLHTLKSASDKGEDLGDFDSLNIKQESPLLVKTAYLLQYIVGIGFLIGFSWWTFYLIQKGLGVWGILTAIFALIGLYLPFNARSEVKQRNQDKDQLALAMGNFGDASLQQDRVTTTEAATPIPGVQKPAQQEVESGARWQNLDDMMLHYAGMDSDNAIPQDSTLKRHFLTTILAESESVLDERPTDSTLQRHYDAKLDEEVASRLLSANKNASQSSPVIASVAVVPEVQAPVVQAKPDTVAPAEKENIPEDSMLRRHYLNNLERG